MDSDLYLYSESTILEQMKTAPYQLGYYILLFYTEEGRPVNKRTGTVGEFYLYPSGGTLRDSAFNIVSYEAKFDTYHGFTPPQRQG